MAELDQLIEQVLLASRLEAIPELERHEPVDLLALAAEEASHYDLEATGQSVTVSGDRTLLRQLVRNLVENARRYGGDAVCLAAEGGGSRFRVYLPAAPRSVVRGSSQASSAPCDAPRGQKPLIQGLLPRRPSHLNGTNAVTSAVRRAVTKAKAGG